MTDDRGAAALAERLHAVEDPHLADVSLRQKRLAAAILGRNRRMPLTHQHQLDKLPRPDPLAEALPGRRTDLVRRWQRLDATNAEMSDYMRRHLDAAGYVIVSKGEVRPELTVGRLAAALRECGWTPAMVEDEAAAILAALAAEADDAD